MFYQVQINCTEHELIRVVQTSSASDEVVSWYQCKKCGLIIHDNDDSSDPDDIKEKEGHT